jgi:hypothetical protein
MVLAGLMMGILPCLSAHSFIGIGEYALFICAINFPWRPFRFSAILQWAKFGVPAALIALPQVLWLMRTKRRDFFVVKPIWFETNTKLGFFTMWWESLGAFVMLSLFHVWFAMTKRQRLMYWPAIGVFVVSNFLRYQPGAMDNTKVYLCAWYPLACVAVAEYIVATLLRARAQLVFVTAAVVLVVFGFVFGSIVCIYKALIHPFPMFSNDEMQFGIWVMQNTRRDAKMLAEGWHASPMMSIGGRLITMGYAGWIWSHGLDYGGRLDWSKRLAHERENISRFDLEGISYAVWKTNDKNESIFPDPGPYSRWTPVLMISNAILYRLLRK